MLDGRDELVLDDLMRDGSGHGGAVAVTVADVRTLRAVQLKGHALRLEPATPVDVERAARFCDEFITDVSTNDGTPRALLERLVPGRYVACVVAVDGLFDQTPGPRAGVPLPVDGS
ncbi:MAG: hypothetical protein JOZ99_13900 [Actinobacteria bacterium]|nr:hypothetical protein [Actinomycetota bacterium]